MQDDVPDLDGLGAVVPELYSDAGQRLVEVGLPDSSAELGRRLLGLRGGTAARGQRRDCGHGNDSPGCTASHASTIGAAPVY